jgi:hypothetical protein
MKRTCSLDGYLTRALFTLSLMLASTCGGPKGGGVCGETTCSARQTCDESSSPARCKCLAAYTGATCMSCARGFTTNAGGDCVEITIDCQANPNVCGTRGSCVDVGTGNDVCSCKPGYAGHACGSCADGYQDNDSNGVCEASCLSSMTTCAAPQVCSDATGRRVCSCPGGRTGTSCDQCPSGYVLRPSDQTCVQTCTSIGSSCGTRKYCDDSQGMPVCVCMAGFAGADCTACAEGYLPDGSGSCVRTAPAGTTLLGAGRWQNSDYLLAIDPATSSATPLRPVANLSGIRLATDVAGKTIYTTSGNVISKLNATGQSTAVVTLSSVQGATFGAGALYSVGAIAPNVLTRIDPATGARSDLGATNLAGGQNQASLTWDSAGALLYARPPTTGATNGAELYRLDMANAAAASMGAVAIDATHLRPSDNRVGLAMDTAGKLFLALRLGRTPEEVLTDHCRKLAAGLGYAGYEQAPFTLLEINYNGVGAGLTRSFTSHGTSGKEIIAYASYGKRSVAKAAFRIETNNPEALVCLSSYEEVIELLVPAETARFAAVVMAGQRPTLTLVVEGAVRDVTKPTLHVHAPSGSVASAFSAYSFVKVYSSAEWSPLKLPVYASAWDSDPTAPTVLMELDPVTLVPLRQMSFPGIELYPTIAPWSP